MWFKRMILEEWFDDYQYAVKYDIGESAVKYLTFGQLGINIDDLPIRYGYHHGRPDLRACIAEQYPGLSAKNIVVTSGGSEAIFLIASALLKPGDHVIVEHPNYPSLYEIPRSLNCDVSFLELTFENNFKPDLKKLDSLVTPRTKLVSLTHPNNPTGSMITRQELDELIHWVEARDLHLLFDETYREMVFDATLPPAATLSPNVISISSMSKCYGLPGIRIGWMATQDPAMLDSVLNIREQVTITNNAIGEEIALRVLQQKEKYLQKARASILENRGIVAAWMDQQEDFEWVFPEAGVVSMPRLKADVKVDPEKLYRRLAEEYKTFTIPGRCFEMDNRYFRLGFGSNPEEIRIGLTNLNKALNDLRE
ncbi:MAG: aminotransferase class I/II-fold pyridoxal phosphate-dependent enzyme [Leptolinea sp.]|nr:aminotransferase class I/II-fold pyridoxal phosphate-dependent enzyme [Leptolinea sp.]